MLEYRKKMPIFTEFVPLPRENNNNNNNNNNNINNRKKKHENKNKQFFGRKDEEDM